VSKAFTNEDTPTPDDAEALPPRAAPLPITPAGLARLQLELAELTRANRTDGGEVGRRRARVIAQALKSIYVLDPSAPDGRVAFGTHVTLEDADGHVIAYEIVGPDEVDVAAGRISVASPVAKTLLGKGPGDTAVLRRPKGDLHVTVTTVSV